MAKLIYAAIASLDGYVEDEEGWFDWAAPDDEVHAFVNDLERPIAFLVELHGVRDRLGIADQIAAMGVAEPDGILRRMERAVVG